MTDTPDIDDPLAKALADQRIVFERTLALEATNRRQRWMLAALAAVVAVLLVGGIIGARALGDLRANTERDTAARAATSLDGCRIRNGAARGNRETFDHFYDALARLFPTPGGQEFVANLRAEAPIPRAEDQDLDCNATGNLDEGDYPS